jgi:hypothetical protein
VAPASAGSPPHVSTARIAEAVLLLTTTNHNHEDFGGHAERNEFQILRAAAQSNCRMDGTVDHMRVSSDKKKQRPSCMSYQALAIRL